MYIQIPYRGLSLTIFSLFIFCRYLYDNKFEGQIPASIGNLVNLRELVMGENYFSGTLPTEFNQLANLEQLSMQNQKGAELMEGPLPDFAEAGKLWYLDISNNDFGPEIPDNLLIKSAVLDNPITLLMRNNDFTGTIPVSFDRFAQLYIDLADNRITGIPPELCNKAEWMNGAEGEIIPDETSDNVDHSCDSLLCPIGYYSAAGRQDTLSRSCTKCNNRGNNDNSSSAEYRYFGQTKCLGVDEENLERSILTGLFTATDGPNSWTKKQFWGSESPICSWEGVTCAGDLQDDNGVETLDLVNNNMRGTLPRQVLWALPSLKQLSLRGNAELVVSLLPLSDSSDSQDTEQATVPAPTAQFGNSILLEVLDVSYAHVTSLKGLEQATNLREFYADQSKLYGKICCCGSTLLCLSLSLLTTVTPSLTVNGFANCAGPFPKELLSIPTLETIHMNWNFLVGKIPWEIGLLSSLSILHLSGNDFHGQVPSSIGLLAKLQEVVLDDCLLSGELPMSDLSALPQLRHFSVVRLAKSGRQLTGHLPPFDKLSMLESLGLESNDLTGSIPENFLAASVGVQEVVLNHNNLVGDIPDGLTSLSDLHLSVVDNQISEVAQDFCENNQWVTELAALYNNSCDGFLCAPGTANAFGRAVDSKNLCTPCEMDEAPFYGSTSCNAQPNQRAILVEFYHELQGSSWYRNDYWLSKASFCDWYGVACDNGDVIAINLDGNNLVGTVPLKLFQLPKLQLLWLSFNSIEINFLMIEQAKNLLDLRLESIGLTSVTGIGRGKKLTALSIGSNKLSGPFPDDLLMLENIRLLNVTNNTLTGSLPSFGPLRYLRSLQLNHNQFNGSLPSFVDSLNLLDVQLAGNKFDGIIPNDFLYGVPPTLPVRVDLSNNLLTGGIPSEFSRFTRLNIGLQQNQISKLPIELCEQNDWNNGDVGRYGCDGLLCHPGSSSFEGRHSSLSENGIYGTSCVECPEASTQYFGQTVCGESSLSALENAASGAWTMRPRHGTVIFLIANVVGAFFFVVGW